MMFSIFNKTLMAVLFCLIFVGQTMAASLMSYQMNMSSMHHSASRSTSEPSSISANSSPSAHQHHNMHKMSTDDMHKMSTDDMHMMEQSDANDNCCATECQCLTSGCFSVFALANVLIQSISINTMDKIHLKDLAILQQVSPSLYRPPILS